MAVPVQGLVAEYRIAPNGTSYFASVQVQDTDKFEFFETGLLGERIPTHVGSVSLSGDCHPCNFNWSGQNIAIEFKKGNYTVSYQGAVHENHFIQNYDRPYTVTISLPDGFDVRNAALGMVSRGAEISGEEGKDTLITWNSTRQTEIRFYDEGREALFFLFANIWIIIAVVMLLPFLLTWRKRK